jgi:hypothetical protein
MACTATLLLRGLPWDCEPEPSMPSSRSLIVHSLRFGLGLLIYSIHVELDVAVKTNVLDHEPPTHRSRCDRNTEQDGTILRRCVGPEHATETRDLGRGATIAGLVQIQPPRLSLRGSTSAERSKGFFISGTRVSPSSSQFKYTISGQGSSRLRGNPSANRLKR